MEKGLKCQIIVLLHSWGSRNWFVSWIKFYISIFERSFPLNTWVPSPVKGKTGRIKRGTSGISVPSIVSILFLLKRDCWWTGTRHIALNPFYKVPLKTLVSMNFNDMNRDTASILFSSLSPTACPCSPETADSCHPTPNWGRSLRGGENKGVGPGGGFRYLPFRRPAVNIAAA